jgi:DNA polymerase I-like protein with 3'-5' exonuclease and polymerase domains
MTYCMVTTIEHLEEVLDAIGDGVAALDFETTSFTPDTGHVRLAQVCSDDVWAVIDFFAIGEDLGAPREEGFRKVAHWFADAAWIVFNAGFEQRWFMQATAEPITCWDVGYLRRAIEGGGHFSLANMCLWDLEHTMPKDEQASDWGADVLTASQIAYAADDALWTWRLWRHWRAKADDGHMAAFNMLNDMIPAVIEMETSGLPLDPERHQELVDHWTELRDERVEALRQLVTDDEIENIRSGKQWNDFFSTVLPDEYLAAWPKTDKTGLLSTANADLKKVAALFHGTPFQDALILLSEFKTLDKYLSSFGEGLITRAHLDPEGRIRARYNIAAARTGRFSSSGPNLQQIPRDREFFGERLSVRRSFVASPGHQLVSLDYSGIELRVLALLSGDDQLLHDMVEGDVHLEMGSYMEIRQSAKAVSFGIVYGISSLGLSVTLRSGMGRAQELIDYWASRYSKAFELRSQALSGRRRTPVTCAWWTAARCGWARRPAPPSAPTTRCNALPCR